jgi:hypothetical protein
MTTPTGEFEKDGEGADKIPGTWTAAYARRHCDLSIKKHARASNGF